MSRSFRANATEINMSPSVIRYVFIIRMKGSRDCVKAVTTFRAMKDNIDDRSIDSVESIRVVDLRTNKIGIMHRTRIFQFMEEWRNNYFDPDWSISGFFYI